MNKQRISETVLHQHLSSFIQKTFETVVAGRRYLHNWHINAIAWHLTLCARGEINRLIITVPPRHLKSICATVAFPAWVLGHDPTKRIVTASYADALAVSHAHLFRMVIESPWYRQVFPGTRIHPKKNTETEVVFTRDGYRLATTVGGSLTGRGGDIAIIDDPIKAQDALSRALRRRANEWFNTTLLSRLDDKEKGIIIIIMQRLHPDDLVAHLLAQGGWTHLDLPAIAETPQAVPIGLRRVKQRGIGDVLHPEREPRHVLERIKEEMGTYAFSAQYQQAPVPPEGNIVRWGWFQTYDDLPDPSEVTQRVWSWDTASKADELNDYSVGTLWYVAGSRYYLARVVRRRLEFPSLKKLIVECALHEPSSDILIEDKASGTQLIQDLQQEGLVHPIAVLPEADKVTRMAGQSAKIEAGQVYLPKQAPWLAEFQNEVLAFPNGAHDDQVDSMSQFLAWGSRYQNQEVDWNLY